MKTLRLIKNARMRTLTFRNLDDDTILKLRERAAANGRSVKAELREIVTLAAAEVTAEQIANYRRDRKRLLLG